MPNIQDLRINPNPYRWPRVFLFIGLVVLTGASSAFAGFWRNFTLERSRTTGWTRWECEDGSASGSEPTRGSARRTARAACGYIIASDPTGPIFTLDATHVNLSGTSAAQILLTTPTDETGQQPSADASGDGNTAEAGVVVPLSEAVSLDLGLFFGTGQARQDVNGRTADGTFRRGVENVDFDLFGGDAAIRLYPVEGDRVRPWVALGIRDSFARPSGGRIDFASGPSTKIPEHELETVRETSAFARAGIDLRWSEKGRVTLSGEYRERSSWSARFGVGFAIGGTALPGAPPHGPGPVAMVTVKPCNGWCRFWGGIMVQYSGCMSAPDGQSHINIYIITDYSLGGGIGSVSPSNVPGSGPCL